MYSKLKPPYYISNLSKLFQNLTLVWCNQHSENLFKLNSCASRTFAPLQHRSSSSITTKKSNIWNRILEKESPWAIPIQFLISISQNSEWNIWNMAGLQLNSNYPGAWPLHHRNYRCEIWIYGIGTFYEASVVALLVVIYMYPFLNSNSVTDIFSFSFFLPFVLILVAVVIHFILYVCLCLWT